MRMRHVFAAAPSGLSFVTHPAPADGDRPGRLILMKNLAYS
jgi:hypothetical protein